MASFESMKDLEMTIREYVLAPIFKWPTTGYTTNTPMGASFVPEPREAHRNYQRDLASEHGSYRIFYKNITLGAYTPYLNRLEIYQTTTPEHNLIAKVLERTFYHYLDTIKIDHLQTEEAKPW